MAVKKAAGGKKSAQGSSAAKPKAAAKSAVKKAAAPAPKKAAAPKAAAPKKAAVKKAAAAVKLSTSQADLLKKVHGVADPAGYRPEKKEQRTADSLHEKKLLKRGAKHKESGTYHYQVSNTGKKHVETTPSTTSTPAGTGGSTGGSPPASGS